MKDWLPLAQRLVDSAKVSVTDNGTRIRYNDLIDAIATALGEASNPVNISDHDPWMQRMAGRLADLDIRLHAVEKRGHSAPMGCVCPAGAEQTCMASLCPRRGVPGLTVSVSPARTIGETAT